MPAGSRTREGWLEKAAVPLPSAPLVPLPQAYALPSSVAAYSAVLPDATAVGCAPFGSATTVGTFAADDEPLPISQSLPVPQTYRLPSEPIASASEPPAVILFAVTPAGNWTWTGVEILPEATPLPVTTPLPQE